MIALPSQNRARLEAFRFFFCVLHVHFFHASHVKTKRRKSRAQKKVQIVEWSHPRTRQLHIGTLPVRRRGAVSFSVHCPRK